ncbi:MAG: flippase-like domain-containing protein, partial [Bdellovibrionales bacterium]|nr:flippase-like domain-containing protein [Bdellovibrionales bacterium]
MRQILFQVFKLLFAGALIFWMIQGGKLDFQSIFRSYSGANLAILLTLLLIILANNNWRWWLLLKSFGLPFTYLYTLRLTLVGLFFNYAMPGGVGGDVVKGYYLVRDHKEQRAKTLGTVLMDRIVGMHAMAAFGLGAMLVQWQMISENPKAMTLFWSVLALNIAILLFFALTMSEIIFESARLNRLLSRLPGGSIFKKIHEVFFLYREKKKTLVVAFLLSLISQIVNVVFFFIAAQFMGYEEATWSSYMFVVPVGLIAMAL